MSWWQWNIYDTTSYSGVTYIILVSHAVSATSSRCHGNCIKFNILAANETRKSSLEVAPTISYSLVDRKFSAVLQLVRSPVLWTVYLMFCACFFLFFSPTHFFRSLQTDIFETFPHDVALLEKEALQCRFPKSAPNKKEWGAKTPKFCLISRLIAT